jgi:uncharacterized membrane protein
MEARDRGIGRARRVITMRRVALVFLLVAIAVWIDWSVLTVMQLNVHSAGAVAACVMTIVSFVLLPPMILSLFLGGVAPLVLHAIVVPLEVLYLWSLYIFARRVRETLKAMDAEQKVR